MAIFLLAGLLILYLMAFLLTLLGFILMCIGIRQNNWNYIVVGVFLMLVGIIGFILNNNGVTIN